MNRVPSQNKAIDLRPGVAASALAGSGVIAARREVCRRCAWNQDNICQHFGCLPCQQRKDGGLWRKTLLSAEKCPDLKW